MLAVGWSSMHLMMLKQTRDLSDNNLIIVHIDFNSLWPSNAVWHNRSQLSLVQLTQSPWTWCS